MAWLPVLLIAAAVLAAVGYAGYRIYGKRR
jgi:hypothetical protein